MSAQKRSRLIYSAILFAGALVVSGVPALAQSLLICRPANRRFRNMRRKMHPRTSKRATSQPTHCRRGCSAKWLITRPTSRPAPSSSIPPHTYLYLTLGGGKAMRYGIGVGREGFTWSGTETIVRKAEWPDWIPPAEMVARQPYLPRWVGGGPGNPLGARAMYLGNTDYRIHGTNDPTTIGKHVSSGCIRLQNSDVIDLYQRVGLGAKVVVLPNDRGQAAAVNARRVAIEQNQGGGSATTTLIAGGAQNHSPTGVY